MNRKNNIYRVLFKIMFNFLHDIFNAIETFLSFGYLLMGNHRVHGRLLCQQDLLDIPREQNRIFRNPRPSLIVFVHYSEKSTILSN